MFRLAYIEKEIAVYSGEKRKGGSGLRPFTEVAYDSQPG